MQNGVKRLLVDDPTGPKSPGLPGLHPVALCDKLHTWCKPMLLLDIDIRIVPRRLWRFCFFLRLHVHHLQFVLSR